MTIIQGPDERLAVKCNMVDKVTPELADTARQMFKTMKEANGIGLSANQVGLDIALMVLDRNGEMLALFNPKLMSQSPQVNTENEGCLSYIGKAIKVKRPNAVVVKYRDINNKMKYIELAGILARAFCHEREHLMGEDFTKHEEKL